eukprot:11191382-Lingulodinium_polyedra.AAC.1
MPSGRPSTTKPTRHRPWPLCQTGHRRWRRTFRSCGGRLAQSSRSLSASLLAFSAAFLWAFDSTHHGSPPATCRQWTPL